MSKAQPFWYLAPQIIVHIAPNHLRDHSITKITVRPFPRAFPPLAYLSRKLLSGHRT